MGSRSSSGSSLAAAAESRLTMAIADLCHAEALPFNLPEKPRFKIVLALAKGLRSKYVPPSRKDVSTELLDLNFQQYKIRNLYLLLKQSEVFGLSFLGDGSTVKNFPLVNMLGSGVHCSAAVLDITDCTGHLEG